MKKQNLFPALVLTILIASIFSSCKKTEIEITNNYYPKDTVYIHPNDSMQPPVLANIRLTNADNSGTIKAIKSQKIILTLPSSADGGYIFNEPVFDSSVLSLDQHTNSGPVDPHVVGDSGYDTWTFSIKTTGFTILRVTATRPWNGETVEKFNATIVVN